MNRASEAHAHESPQAPHLEGFSGKTPRVIDLRTRHEVANLLLAIRSCAELITLSSHEASPAALATHILLAVDSLSEHLLDANIETEVPATRGTEEAALDTSAVPECAPAVDPVLIVGGSPALREQIEAAVATVGLRARGIASFGPWSPAGHHVEATPAVLLAPATKR